MNTSRESLFKLCLVVLATATVTASAIYLTPLKHFNLISPTMNEVDPAAFYKEFTANPDKYLFVDVRSAREYAEAHPKGSINIRIADLADPVVRSRLPKSGKQIALTCTDGKLAAVAYGYLQNWGYQNLLHITGGLQLWTIEGLPVEGTSVPAGSVSLAAATRLVCPG
jgi:rhodanese-related sulfurtransferase